jgi:hypothetical protein
MQIKNESKTAIFPVKDNIWSRNTVLSSALCAYNIQQDSTNFHDLKSTFYGSNAPRKSMTFNDIHICTKRTGNNKITVFITNDIFNLSY